MTQAVPCMSLNPAWGKALESKQLWGRGPGWGTGGECLGTNRLRKHLCPSMVRRDSLVPTGTTPLWRPQVGFREPALPQPPYAPGRVPQLPCLHLLLPQLPLPAASVPAARPPMLALSPVSHAVPLSLKALCVAFPQASDTLGL